MDQMGPYGGGGGPASNGSGDNNGFSNNPNYNGANGGVEGAGMEPAKNTLWSVVPFMITIITDLCRMGELEPWMDENFIKGVFMTATGEAVNVKVIRDKTSGYEQTS